MRHTSWLAPLAILLSSAFALPAYAADADGDGLEDSDELAFWGTDPNDANTDGSSSWNDFRELLVEGTSPVLTDTDGDSSEDETDSAPLDPAGGTPDGGSPTNSGFRNSIGWARSGESPYDGVNVCLVDGTFRMTLGVGTAKGVGPLAQVLPISYDSRAQVNGLTGNWSSPLDTWINELPGTGDVVVLDFDGIVVTWEKVGSVYVPPAGCLDTLEKDGSQFVRRTPDGFKITYGSLDKIEDRDGNTIDYTYTAGKPTSITDTRGQTHTLTYYSAGRLQKITMADGAEWTFYYNVTGQLWKVTGPATTSFPYGITHEFRYTNGASASSLNGNLLAASDGNGVWWLRNRYDTSDRVVKQYVGGANRFTFDYTNATSQEVTVTDRAGNERVWKWHATKLTKTELSEKTNRGVRSGEGDYVTTWDHDSAGYLIEVEYPRGNGVEYTLNAVKRPTEIRRKADVDASNGASDLVETYAYDASKYWGVTSYTDPEGHATTYTLDADGRPTTVTFPTLTAPSPDVTVTNSYSYNANGTLASFTDGEGKVTSYSYFTTGARKGRLQEKVVDDGGLDLTWTYDYEAWGDLKSVTDPRGNTTTYTVERYGNVTEVDAPSALGYVTRFTHDANLNVTQRQVKNIDWDGTWLSSPQWWTTTYAYTMMDRVCNMNENVTDAEVRTTVFEYDANDNLAKVMRDGRETRMTYDERDLLFERTREGGAAADLTERWDYDGNRNTTLHRNARGKDTATEYDLFDRRTKTVNALGHYEVVVYDKDGRVTERQSYEEAGATDILLAHHKAHFDEMGRFVKEEDALLGGSTTWYAREYTLDKRGLVVTAKDRRNYETDFAYDGAGRRTSATDPLGNETSWEFDENGNVTATEETEVIPGSSSTETYRTEFEYDAANRQKKRTEIDRTNSANTKVTEWKRNALGVVRKEIDPKGYETTRTADGLARVVEESRDMGRSAAIVTQWTWSLHDQVTRLRDDNSHDTDYEYDVFGRLVTKTYENAKTVSYLHDANGNVVEIEDQNGTVIAQGFDDLDRLTGRNIMPATSVGGDTNESFMYDALNRLTEAKDDDSIVQFTYDSLSRLLTETQGSNPLGTTAKTVCYSWDAESNRAKIDYPSGFDANEARDALGRITSITDGSSATVASFSLYGAGLRRKQVTLPNATTANYTYDGFRRPTSIDHKTSGGSEFAGFDYAWDANDNPLYEARSHQSGKGDVYTYDQANRLTKVLRDCDDPVNEVANPGAEAYDKKLEYDMDDVFNLTAYKVTPYGGSTTTTSYTTDAMNQYTAIGGQSLTYTDAGSLASDGTFTYKYDAHEHLIEVKQGSSTIATYTYDALGLGRRTGKTVGSAVTRYIYAGQQSIEEYDGTSGSATLARLFVFGQQIDQIVMMEAPDYGDVDQDSNTSEVLRFSYHTQLVGSVTHVIGPTGSVVEQYLYDPYGKPTIKDGAGSTISASAIRNPYLFTARQLDEETGLHYYRARHYSPDLRRFIQSDPAEYIDGPNDKAYCGSSPASVTDPSGLAPLRPTTESDFITRKAGGSIQSVLKTTTRTPMEATYGPWITIYTIRVAWIEIRVLRRVGRQQVNVSETREVWTTPDQGRLDQLADDATSALEDHYQAADAPTPGDGMDFEKLLPWNWPSSLPGKPLRKANNVFRFGLPIVGAVKWSRAAGMSPMAGARMGYNVFRAGRQSTGSPIRGVGLLMSAELAASSLRHAAEVSVIEPLIGDSLSEIAGSAGASHHGVYSYEWEEYYEWYEYKVEVSVWAIPVMSTSPVAGRADMTWRSRRRDVSGN